MKMRRDTGDYFKKRRKGKTEEESMEIRKSDSIQRQGRSSIRPEYSGGDKNRNKCKIPQRRSRRWHPFGEKRG